MPTGVYDHKHIRGKTGESHPAWKGNKSKCEICQKELSHRSSKRCKNHRTVSEETRDKIRKTLFKGGKPKCLDCGKVVSSYGIKRCMKCHYKFCVGKNHPNWKNGASKVWRKVHKDKVNFWTSQRRKRLSNVDGSHNFGEWGLLKRQYGYTCPACKRSEPEIKLVQDHIIPITKGGSNYIENIQPLCGSCNAKKHTKVIKF